MGQFLFGFSVAFGAAVGGVIAWRRLAREKRQEDHRIHIPTTGEIEKYGKNERDRPRKTEGGIGAFLTLIIGAVYTYFLWKHGHGVGVPGHVLFATVIFTASGVFALAQGASSIIGSVGSTWRALVWTTVGAFGVVGGTYAGISTTAKFMESKRPTEVVNAAPSVPELLCTDRKPRATDCHSDRPTCVSLPIPPAKKGVTRVNVSISKVFGQNFAHAPNGMTLWFRGNVAGDQLTFTLDCNLVPDDKDKFLREETSRFDLSTQWRYVDLGFRHFQKRCGSLNDLMIIGVFGPSGGGGAKATILLLDRGRVQP